MKKGKHGGHKVSFHTQPPDLCLQRKRTSPRAPSPALGSCQELGAEIWAASGWCPVITHLQSPAGAQDPARPLPLKGLDAYRGPEVPFFPDPG